MREGVLAGLAALVFVSACAGGGESNASASFSTSLGDSNGNGDGDGDGDGESGDTTSMGDGDGDGDGTPQDMSPSTSMGDGDGDGDGDCDEPCTSPPGTCFEDQGSCVAGECVYDPKPAGTDCEDGDDCTVGDECNAMGVCLGGDALECSAPNATGVCSDGGCAYTCTGDWENCDGDWDNGCEIETGVANVCSQNGMDADGCGTAYCGSNGDALADFGTWYCEACVNCNHPQAGEWRWCNTATGIYFPPESTTAQCGGSEDLVCPAP